ncbi:hypothetical protein FE257_002319 [Aspergillus nanangensis]|uniref:Uncharacterized protein n=1 Tax=Aspergillus nanangensis TaxID=2582783 RepID=A0AAD4CCS9_ASPNN|nr:hypothetical protein FE257_002319 [Aspergillus nanangensis]
MRVAKKLRDLLRSLDCLSQPKKFAIIAFAWESHPGAEWRVLRQYAGTTDMKLDMRISTTNSQELWKFFDGAAFDGTS